MERQQLLEYTARLGQEFQRRKMTRHIHLLRLYYAALRHGLDEGPGHTVDARWTPEAVDDWLRIFRLPPHEDTYEVRSDGLPCLRCKPGKGGRPAVLVEVEIPGIRRVRCESCRAVWLVKTALEGEAGAKAGRG